MPQSDPPPFRQTDAELIRQAANLTERDFGRNYLGFTLGDHFQPLRDIADRVEAECENGVPSDFTEDDVVQLNTLARDLTAYDPGTDPDKLTPTGKYDFKWRHKVVEAAERIAATITDRLERGAR